MGDTALSTLAKGSAIPARLQALTRIIDSRTPASGDFPTVINGLGLFRREAPSPPVTCILAPSIVLVVQGAKEMVIGSDVYPYDTTRFLITSLDVPANSAVTLASADVPCLGLVFKLDLRTLTELIAQGEVPTPRERAVRRSAGIAGLTSALLDPLARLVNLLQEPDAIPVLWPLLQREIHFRLLQGDQAPLLRHIASVDSQGYRIAKAIDWLKLNYASALRVEDLAARVQMSAPNFHLHFRNLTSMSPLQYQKWLRLNEARRLMLNEQQDAASAAFKVGYESPSQFSREYGRLFGAPPKKDIARMRSQAVAAS
ncbi:AraC-like DNA-binding protein [Pseudomonas graminis]|uniref:AraC family transcriptional regulator n=1 Tax=Pseudomonas graminis TaxID=158627 RepID=UPI00105F97DD|nr:AraC family transcriptional regulator [Pseudomonas graminis]TDV56987.1 AraC-like DNA-binding protein [Pseudomonas graminis]